VSVAAQIIQNGIRAHDRPFGKDDPTPRTELAQECREGTGGLKRLELAVELEFSSGMQLEQSGAEFALEHFGEDRCFCGGDWPVSLLAGGYARTWKTYVTLLEELLSPAGQEKVLYKNAKHFYNL